MWVNIFSLSLWANWELSCRITHGAANFSSPASLINCFWEVCLFCIIYYFVLLPYIYIFTSPTKENPGRSLLLAHALSAHCGEWVPIDFLLRLCHWEQKCALQLFLRSAAAGGLHTFLRPCCLSQFLGSLLSSLWLWVLKTCSFNQGWSCNSLSAFLFPCCFGWLLGDGKMPKAILLFFNQTWIAFQKFYSHF